MWEILFRVTTLALSEIRLAQEFQHWSHIAITKSAMESVRIFGALICHLSRRVLSRLPK